MPATTPRRSPQSVLDVGAGHRAFGNSSTPTLGKSLSAQRRAVGRLSDGLSDSTNNNNHNNNNDNNKMPRAAPVSPSPSPSPSAGHPSRRRSASGDDGMELLAEADLVAPRRRSCSGENSLGLDLDLLMLPDDGAGVRGQEKRHHYPDKLGPLESARVKAAATAGGDRLFITTPRGHEHRRKTPRLVHSASPRHQPADLDAVVAAAAVPVPEMSGAGGNSDTETIATAAAVMLATAGGGGRKKVDPFVASLMKPTASLQSIGAAIAQRSKLRKPRPVGGVTSPLAAEAETGGGKPVRATTPPRRHARSFSQQPTNMTEVADRVLAAAAVAPSAHRVDHSNPHLACIKSSDSSSRNNNNNFRKPKPMDLTPLAATSHRARTLNPEQQQLLAPLHGDGGSGSTDAASPSSAARETFLLHMDDLLTPTPENSPRHHHQQRRRASRPRAGSHTGSTPGSTPGSSAASSPKAGSTPRRREHHGSRRLGMHGSSNNNNNNPLDAVERVARESKVNGVEAPKPPTPTDRKPLPGAARLSSGHSVLSSPVPSPSPSPSVSPTNHAQPRRRRLHSHFEGLQSSRSAALPSRSPSRSPTAAAESKVPATVESKVCH